MLRPDRDRHQPVGGSACLDRNGEKLAAAPGAVEALLDGGREPARQRGGREQRDTEDEDAPSPEDLAVGAEERGRVGRLLDQLLPDQRRILELRLAGLTSKEIAAALGRTPNAVDQAQFRALSRLRTLLSAAERGPEGSR